MKTTLLFLSSLLALTTISAQAQFTYTTNTDNTITVTGYTGPGGDVTIPSTINGLSVTSIGDSAFENLFSLTEVTIPDSVTNIGNYAFADCGNLTGGATLGIGVTSIGDGAFYDSGLSSLTVPNSVTNIGDNAFGECPSLTSVFFNGNSPNDDSTAMYPAFDGDPATVYYLSNTTGWSNTFDGQPTVMLAGPPQFGATADGWMYLSDQIKITMITGYAGSNSAVVIPSTINGLPVIGIGGGAFLNNSNLTSIIIPDSVTSIGVEAFAHCDGLTSVTMGNGVTNIGDRAFTWCLSLTDMSIPDSVTSIGDLAFRLCIHLVKVTVGRSVTSIGGGAFAVCTSLSSVYFTGNAPNAYGLFFGSYGGFDFYDPITVYYLPGTLGWSDFAANMAPSSVPTALWYLPNPLILNQDPGFGVQSNHFGFTISWATNVSVVVEACSILSNPLWIPVSTNSLVDGTSYFSDPQPANLPARFYRLRSP